MPGDSPSDQKATHILSNGVSSDIEVVGTVSPPLWLSTVVQALESIYLDGAGARDAGNHEEGILGVLITLGVVAGGVMMVFVGPPICVKGLMRSRVPSSLILLLGWAAIVAIIAAVISKDPVMCPEAGISPGMPQGAVQGLDWWTVLPLPASGNEAGPQPASIDWLTPIETEGTHPTGAPIIGARSGWGRPWVGRGAVSTELLHPWSIEALAASEEGDWPVSVQRGNVEQGSTIFEDMPLARVLSPVPQSGIHIDNNRGREQDQNQPPPYLAEDASLLGQSPRLKAAAEAVADAVVTAGYGFPAAVVRLTMLWAGGGGALSGLHSDPDPTNVLAQLEGSKDVWIFHPLDTEVLGASEKFDMGARLALSDGFKLWRPPGGVGVNSSDRLNFPAGDACIGLNTVTSLGRDEGKQTAYECQPWDPVNNDTESHAHVSSSLRGVLHVRLFPGDVLLIPQGWMHMARPRTPGISLSVRPVSGCESLRRFPEVFLTALHDVGLYRWGDCTCHS